VPSAWPTCVNCKWVDGCRRRVDQFGDAEIREPRPAVFSQEHVGRLDVAVDHALLVGMGHGTGEGVNHAGGGFGFDRPLGKPVVEGFAIDKSQREIMPALKLPKFVTRHDIRVIEPACGFRFPHKPLDLAFDPLGSRFLQNLNGDGPVQTPMAGFVDVAHSSAADDFEKFIIPELPGRFIGVLRGSGFRLAQAVQGTGFRFVGRGRHVLGVGKEFRSAIVRDPGLVGIDGIAFRRIIRGGRLGGFRLRMIVRRHGPEPFPFQVSYLNLQLDYNPIPPAMPIFTKETDSLREKTVG
jgi:hypothetical protein